MVNLLEFETELAPLERDLEHARSNGGAAEAPDLQEALDEKLRVLYSGLTPWQKVQVARHRDRPYTLDYVQRAFGDFVELRGDRGYADDRALIGGLASLNGRSVMVLGHQKGRDTRENIVRNFGMPHPEGYRKAERLMRQAEHFGLPLVTFIDTPGANAGLADEERGQAEAIASSIGTMLALRIPTVAVVIGEGGSGGALAIASADRILMLEHSVFTVASPEAAAAILWHDSGKAAEAAANMRITARDLRDLGLIEQIVPEPVGGAHRDPAAMAESLVGEISRAIDELSALDAEERLDQRYRKYRDISFYVE
ncbi:MAG: acetyl-CoA carboxylase carboxyltransferase subunit alpha [Chloroflexota bacterium]